MDNRVQKIATYILSRGRIDRDRKIARWGNLSVEAVNDWLGMRLILCYPTSTAAAADGRRTSVRRRDTRLSPLVARSGLAVFAANDPQSFRWLKRLGFADRGIHTISGQRLSFPD